MNFPNVPTTPSNPQPRSSLPLMYRNYAKAMTGQSITSMNQFSSILAEQIIKNSTNNLQNEHSN